MQRSAYIYHSNGTNSTTHPNEVIAIDAPKIISSEVQHFTNKRLVRFDNNARGKSESSVYSEQLVKIPRHQQLPQKQQDVGIASNDIRENDVLCGGYGVGSLPTTRRPGDLRFRANVDSLVPDFLSQSNKLQKLHIARLAVIFIAGSIPKGRFLVMNPSTGLWNEVGKAKALSKVLRTFQARIKVLQQARHLKKPIISHMPIPVYIKPIMNLPTKLTNLPVLVNTQPSKKPSN